MEAISDILGYVNDNHIPGELTIHSDAQVAIENVRQGNENSESRAAPPWATRIEWGPGHTVTPEIFAIWYEYRYG
jgi:hypothetical protein